MLARCSGLAGKNRNGFSGAIMTRSKQVLAELWGNYAFGRLGKFPELPKTLAQTTEPPAPKQTLASAGA